MKLNKLFTTLAAGTLMVTLAGCGSSNTTKDSSSSSEVASSSKTTKKRSNVNKDKQSSNNTTSSKNDDVTSSTSTSSQSTGSNSNDNYSVASTTLSASSSAATSSVKQSANSQQSQATMTATDAKNIVKEHIGNQLNNRGIAGQSTSDLPAIDSVDGYTATQNGTNDWTVSGNGHTYHVTANSVTGN